MRNHLFEHFKRKTTLSSKTKTHPKIFFQIDFDKHGAFISVVNSKGKEIEANYLSYSGTTRNILRSIEQIQEKNNFIIDWEKPAERVFFAENDFLIPLLQRANNVVDKEMSPLTFHSGIHHLRVNLTQEDKEGVIQLKSSTSLVVNNEVLTEYQLINEEALIANQQIYNIKPLGEEFHNISVFDTTIKLTDLSIFLSLLYSYLDNVELVFEDFKVILSNEKLYAQPALVFEKVDIDDSLFMRVGQVLPNMAIHVLDQFDLYRYAEINELEKTITVKYIEQEPMETVMETVFKLLKKHKKSSRKKDEQEDVVIEGDLFIIPKDTAAGFIYNELPGLLMQYEIFGAEKLKSYKITTKQPSIDMHLSHGIDFLEGDVSLDFGEEKIDLHQALAQLKKQNYVKLSDGSHALVNQIYLRKLERLFKKKGKGKVQVSFFDLPLIEELIEEKTAKKQFAKGREIFEGFNKLSSKRYKLPKLDATLRPYQKDGFKWLKYLTDNELGGCLADDMGLGKTLQALSILATVYPKQSKPSLIVMPRSLLFNWKSETEKFASQISSHTYYGSGRKWKEAKKANIIFTTYATMRNDIKILKEEEFLFIILDESQNIKNIQAQTTKAAMLLNAKHRIALSGTPIENNLGELYSLFRFLNPSMFGSLQQFGQNYLKPIQKHNDTTAILQLRKKIFPFILRRLKKDVLKDLPDKIEQTLFVSMSDEQQKLYEERRQFYQIMIKQQIALKGIAASRFFVFQALNELRQIATVPENHSEGRIASPKVELLRERLMEAVANGHKVLVFVNFLTAIDLIGKELNEMGVDYVSMTGATRDRQALVNKFQNDANCKAFIMTLKTGGTGLNLTAADTIFIFDPWWNVAAENQAIDRAHRIGQKNKVLAYKLISEGSIEEKILQLQQAKKEIFDNVISADSSAMKSLSPEDIDFILS